MKSITIKKLYKLHTWVGLITGVLMFVVAFTGAVSVFALPELKIWGNPDVRGEVAVPPAQIERLVAEYAKQVPEHYLEEVMIFLPGVRAFNDLTVIFEAHSGDDESEGKPVGQVYRFDPHSLELIGEMQGPVNELFASRETDFADFIRDFHTDLLLGRPVGLLITGLLGLTLMASIATGLFIHRKVLRQLFTFRPRRTLSLTLNDAHKVTGIWGLLFHSTLGFTGAFLGLALVILVPAAAFVSFEGDQDKLIETFTAMPEPELTHIATPTRIGDILTDAHHIADDGSEVAFITVLAYGDKAAMAYVNTLGGNRMATQTWVYQGEDARLLEQFSFYSRLDGFTGKILDVMFPLHFGNFGGALVKVIWLLLGLSTALLPLTGMMLWLERGKQSKHPRYSATAYKRFNQWVIGGCGGLVLACAVLFPMQLLLKQTTWVADIGSFTGWVFFPVWVAALLWAMFSRKPQRTAKQMLWLVAVSLVLAVGFDAAFNGVQLIALVNQGYWVALSVDIGLLTFAAVLFRTLQRWPEDELDNTQPATLTEEHSSC